MMESLDYRALSVWVCFGIHLGGVIFSICLGSMMIAFFMHWLSGRGA